MKFIILDWEDIVRISLRLAKKISASNFRPFCIIGLTRGGLIPARILSDRLGINRLYTLGVSFYTDLAVHKKKPVITQDIDADLLGKEVLVVDDVADTGMSLILSKETLLRRGASEVRLATLHKKPWSKVIPDYYVEETDAWIVYPWEYRETLDLLKKRLTTDLETKEKKTIEEAINRIMELEEKYV